MVANQILFSLDTVDNFSGILSNIDNMLHGIIGNRLPSLGQVFNRVLDGIGRQIKDQFEQVKELEVTTLAAASVLSGTAKISFSSAQEEISEIYTDLTKLAAKLPGVSKEYEMMASSINDTVIEAFKGKNGQPFDTEGYRKAIVETSKNFELLAKINYVPLNSAMIFAQSFLEGQVFKQSAFNKRAPAFLNAVESLLSEQGLKIEDLKKLDEKSRIQLANLAAQKLITPEALTAIGKSIDGQIAEFNDRLFSPRFGIFGWLKDVDPIKKGDQTVASAIARLLETSIDLVNKTGSSFATQIGATVDSPSSFLYSIIESLSDGIKYLLSSGNIFSSLPDLIKNLNIAEFTQTFFARPMQALISNWSGFIKNLNYADLGKSFGQGFNKLIEGIFVFFRNTDWRSVADGMGKMLTGTFTVIESFLRTVNWGNVVIVLAEILETALLSIFRIIFSFIKERAIASIIWWKDPLNWIGNALNPNNQLSESQQQQLNKTTSNFGSQLHNDLTFGILKEPTTKIEPWDITNPNYRNPNSQPGWDTLAPTINKMGEAQFNTIPWDLKNPTKKNDQSSGFSPTINVAYNGDEQDSERLAQKIMIHLEQAWDRYQLAYLA